MSRLNAEPTVRFSSRISRLFPESEIVALAMVGAEGEMVERSLLNELYLRSPMLALTLARGLFEVGRFAEAREIMEKTFPRGSLSDLTEVTTLRAALDLIAGERALAVPQVEHAARTISFLMRAHQNLAARPASGHRIGALDYLAGSTGRIHDLANFVGQRVTHVGEGHLGPKLYALAFQCQEELAAGPKPPLSEGLEQLLERLGLDWETLRILPEEWFTQIGHMGMLDMQFRMHDLGWWTGRPIMLVPPLDLANPAFLTLFADRGPIIVLDETVDPVVSAELVALQRWKGLGFNAFALPTGEIVPWQDAGALMMRQWEAEGRGYPLRTRFDETFGVSETLAADASALREAAGLEPDGWYVCLHMRDAAHYGELAGTGQTHRNADISNYLEVIRYIVALGGRVIKLGGPKSAVLPSMPGYFDYARSRFRSSEMDLHLIRHARLFVGSTSGLTNVAISFGTPCALVNCITIDAQLWGDRVRFAPKWLRRSDGTLLTQREITSTPWRWRMFSAEVLTRYQVKAEENTADEILETVKEVVALAVGRSAEYRASFRDADALLERWRGSLTFPHFYGNSQPSLNALASHPDYLDATSRLGSASAIPALDQSRDEAAG